MSTYNRYNILDTVGIEFETEFITPDSFRDAIGNSAEPYFTTTHDASIETDALLLGRSRLLVKNIDPKLRSLIYFSPITVGTEIVSIPLEEEECNIRSLLESLVVTFEKLGEPERTYRAGVHFHIGMPTNLRILKAIVRLGAYLEDAFFYIGGQGYKFRGTMVNNSAYCRPITKWGPQCVPVSKDVYAQIFNIVDMLESTKTGELWYKYGGTTMDRGGAEKYVPQRYSWLNLYSLLAHGTLEFRCFNKTWNVDYLMAEIELCRKFCELATRSDIYSIKDMGMNTTNSIFDERSKANIIVDLENFSRHSTLDRKSFDLLAKIITTTPQITLPQRYVHSHLRNANQHYYFQNASIYNYIPSIIEQNEIDSSEVVNIHTLRGEY